MKKSVALVIPVAAACALFFVPGGAPCAAQTVEHTIRAGDNLHLVAGYYYRDPRQWKKIWKLNRKALAGPNSLVPGRTLRIESAPDQALGGSYEDFLSRVSGK